jgi:hypothetical protein
VFDALFAAVYAGILTLFMRAHEQRRLESKRASSLVAPDLPQQRDLPHRAHKSLRHSHSQATCAEDGFDMLFSRAQCQTDAVHVGTFGRNLRKPTLVRQDKKWAEDKLAISRVAANNNNFIRNSFSAIIINFRVARTRMW